MLNNDKYLIKLGKKIQKLSKENYTSKVALAKACEIDPRSIGRIYKGTQNPTIITLRKISKALDMDLEELVKV